LTSTFSPALAAVLVLFSCAGSAFGQTGATVVSNRTRKTCVSVRDPQGLPVDAVAVSLEPQAAAAVQRGVTDANGRWCTNAAPGTYVVRAVGRGMEGASRSLTILPGEGEQEVVLPLEISSVASQVQVTASRLPESLLESPLPIRQIDTRQFFVSCKSSAGYRLSIAGVAAGISTPCPADRYSAIDGDRGEATQ